MTTRPATKCDWEIKTMIQTDALMRDERIPYWCSPSGEESVWEGVIVGGVKYRKPKPCPNCGRLPSKHVGTINPY